MSHEIVNYLQVMGFDSGLKDFTASSMLIAISSDWKEKLMAEYASPLEDVR